jgi:hypothetical protein
MIKTFNPRFPCYIISRYTCPELVSGLNSCSRQCRKQPWAVP